MMWWTTLASNEVRLKGKGLGSRDLFSGFGVQGSGFRVQDSGSTFYGFEILGVRLSDYGFSGFGRVGV